MGRLRIPLAGALFFFAAIAAGLAPSDGAARTWRLGGRVVPGPLPPDPYADIPAVDLQTDIVFGTAGGRELRLDFAKPVLCRADKVPLLVYIHGGGWIQGSKDGVIDTPLAGMAFQLGFAVASIDYRLAPEWRFPAQVHDCKLAVRYLRANADALGINPDRIAAVGGSAGGHLASILGTTDDDDGLEGPGLAGISSRVSVVAEYFGPTDLTDVETPLTSEGLSLLLAFLGCHPIDCPGLASQASPAAYVTPDDPPVLIVHGANDALVPYRQAEVFAGRLRAAGNACALIKVGNAGHGFEPTPAGSTLSPGLAVIGWITMQHLARFLEPGVFGDLNLDGRRNYADFRALLTTVGLAGVGPGAVPASLDWNPLADLHPDGIIDGLDLEAFLRRK
jgi:acetyl esterase/lipase